MPTEDILVWPGRSEPNALFQKSQAWPRLFDPRPASRVPLPIDAPFSPGCPFSELPQRMLDEFPPPSGGGVRKDSFCTRPTASCDCNVRSPCRRTVFLRRRSAFRWVLSPLFFALHSQAPFRVELRWSLYGPSSTERIGARCFR